MQILESPDPSCYSKIETSALKPADLAQSNIDDGAFSSGAGKVTH